MSLKSLQERAGVAADGAFGPGTIKAGMTLLKLTPVRAAHFFAQTSHETGGFKAFSENLNYSAQGLQGIFGKYFPGTLEESYARQPEKIANRVYADRMGNGNEASGDGWKFIEFAGGKDAINAKIHGLERVFKTEIFNLIEDSWQENSYKEGRLKVCAMKCGVEFDPFAEQFK